MEHNGGDTMGEEVHFRQRVMDSIGTLLPHVLGREVSGMPESTRLFDELGLSSSKTLELLLALEEDLDVHIDVEEIDRKNLASIGSLADFVATHALVNG
jgi:acyl carrier protein